MAKTREPLQVTPDLIAPKLDWSRPLAAPGHMAVDFEERVDFRRLHDYRLARTRASLARSGLGALLYFGNMWENHRHDERVIARQRTGCNVVDLFGTNPHDATHSAHRRSVPSIPVRIASSRWHR